MTPQSNEGVVLPMLRMTIDDTLRGTLTAALDCFRSRTLDNLDTAVSEDETQYFEQVLFEIDTAGAMLNGEERHDEFGRVKQAMEARDESSKRWRRGTSERCGAGTSAIRLQGAEHGKCD